MRDESAVPLASRDIESRLLLIECIERNIEPLLGSISLYARRIGLDPETDSRDQALEILQETVLEALDHIDRFQTTRQPLAWLRGISVNVMKRKKVAQAKHTRREISLSLLAYQQPSPGSEQDILDRLMPGSSLSDNPERTLESAEEVSTILSLVSPADQEVVRLAVLEDRAHFSLAQHLGISTVTARMRFHRALNRLRSAWTKQQKREEKRGQYGPEE